MMKFEELKLTGSVKVSNDTKVLFPREQRLEKLDVSELMRPEFACTYDTNNSTIVFVDIHMVVYVTPYTREAIKTLQGEGFTRKSMYVPFSNGDVPYEENFRWIALRNAALESYKKDYENDCREWADQHGIGEISEQLLKCCFRIPEKGVQVKHLYFDDTYYPLTNELCLDCIGVDLIGKFCVNNGVVVFVYRDGHTYVCRNSDVLRSLREAGYRESDLFVPFSNGEQIVDSFYRKQFEACSAAM